MNDAPGASLLDELDARQNELLEELDQLNARIERVIAQWSASSVAGETLTKLKSAA